MTRMILTVAGVFGASGLLLMDSAVKGVALLMLAAVAALLLRRDSAATRHLVWLLAIVALLGVPWLSRLLPQLSVLPAWVGTATAAGSREPTTPLATPTAANPSGTAIANGGATAGSCRGAHRRRILRSTGRQLQAWRRGRQHRRVRLASRLRIQRRQRRQRPALPRLRHRTGTGSTSCHSSGQWDSPF
jgi:hypothetical protein